MSDPEHHIHIGDWRVVAIICLTILLLVAEVGIFKVFLL